MYTFGSCITFAQINAHNKTVNLFTRSGCITQALWLSPVVEDYGFLTHLSLIQDAICLLLD